MTRDFKNIKAWQFADDLAVEIYSVTKSFPKEELYGLTSQLRRAGVSVPTNIAEGASREYKKEYFHFLTVARGSISEVEYLLHLSSRLGYLDNSNYKRLEGLRVEAGRTLYGLIEAVKKEI
jgi:four helix bundle protein